MLYILHCANHPDLKYRGGQRPILHLQADLFAVVRWADENRRKWAFSNTNAGAFYADFFKNLDQLSEINWNAVVATDFRTAIIKEGKRAEFLVFRWFPWSLVERIGVIDRETGRKAMNFLEGADHQPAVKVDTSWYY